MDNQGYDEEEVRLRRRRRIQEAKKQKYRQMMLRRFVCRIGLPAGAVIVILLLIFAGRNVFDGKAGEDNVRTQRVAGTNWGDGYQPEYGLPKSAVQTDTSKGEEMQESGNENSTVPKHDSPESTAATKQLGEDIISSHAIIIDVDSDTILAQKGAKERISPASMTKILTVLVAAEEIQNLDDTFTITREILDYSYVNDCSNVGFEENETVTVRDLFYGTILSSGADAAGGLALYTAGSLDAFVEKMNSKLEELGLSKTAHFTNCVGLYDENHYCTVTDMAMILEAAMDNELCREVMSAHTYTTTATEQHPEGLLISNWFLRRIEDKDSGGEVLCGKTGYVVQSGNCAASYAEDALGKGYICVTANANSNWRCIYDHVALYKQFIDVT